MDFPAADAARRRPWPSLWVVALVSLLLQLALCQFFSFGRNVPLSIDVNPCNLWKYAYQFPPHGEFLTLNWFGIPNAPPPLNPFSLAAAHLSPWFFFTTYAPLLGTAALLAMVAFLRELEVSRPAALFGGVVYAWQGDLLTFVFPGHFGYIATWAFFALAAWGALRGRVHWAYALVAGASCGLMVGLQPDRGGIESLLIAALYLGPACVKRAGWGAQIRPFVLCVVTAMLVAVGGILGLRQTNIVGVELGGSADRAQTFAIATQYSLGPVETLTYLAPGFFGWYNGSSTGPYWGWIGQMPGWERAHVGPRNENLAISTVGTAASILALLGMGLLLPGSPKNPRTPPVSASRRGAAASRAGEVKIPTLTERQVVFGRIFLVVGAGSLVLAWGYHTPLYRPLFALPFMDKWRDPLKWLDIFNFAVVVFAAFGAQQLVLSLAETGLRRALTLFLALVNGLLLVLLLASYPLAILVFANLSQGGGYEPAAIADVMHTLHLSLGFALLVGVLLGLALIGVWHGDRMRRWDIPNPWLHGLWQRALAVEHRPATLAVCLAALAVLQLHWVAGQFVRPSELARITAGNSLVDALRAEGPTVRVAVPAPQDPLLNTLLQYQFSEDRISSIDISAASRIPDALTHFVDAFDGEVARLWLIGGVKNVAIGEQGLTALRQNAGVAANIAGADGYTLYPTPDDQPTHALVRMRDYFSKATFIPRAEILATDGALLKRLADPAWNPRDSVLLATAAPGAVPKGTAGSIAAVPGARALFAPTEVLRYTPHQIQLRVSAPGAGYVLINDQYDPDWRAQVNGKAVPLLRADYLLRAVPVEAGVSMIDLRYSAHYRFGDVALPAVVANDFSDAVMLLAWIVAGVALNARGVKGGNRALFG
jgi:hypothetical protein